MSKDDKSPVEGQPDENLNAFLVAMHGDIDVFSFQTLREFFQEWKDKRKEPNLLIDLNEVRYMGSSGWALLFSQNHVAKRRGGMVIIYGANSRLQRSLTMISGNRDILKVALDKTDAQRMLKENTDSAAA